MTATKYSRHIRFQILRATGSRDGFIERMPELVGNWKRGEPTVSIRLAPGVNNARLDAAGIDDLVRHLTAIRKQIDRPVALNRPRPTWYRRALKNAIGWFRNWRWW